jgi:hypothetical protein
MRGGNRMNRIVVVSGLYSLVVICLWGFPRYWYSQADSSQQKVWFTNRTDLPGWEYVQLPVSEGVERILVADRLVNGVFRNDEGRVVRVFSGSRYKERENEIGLFVHTPDRCWTEAGWQVEAPDPGCLELRLDGVPIFFERRIFTAETHRELVYFCGLAGGQPLPYRLDHNLAVGMRTSSGPGLGWRGADSHIWKRVWESFRSRRQLLGPKQFFRISTPVSAGYEDEGDTLLDEFIGQWLVRRIAEEIEGTGMGSPLIFGLCSTQALQ